MRKRQGHVPSLFETTQPLEILVFFCRCVCERQCKEQLEDMDRAEQSGNDEDDIDLRAKEIRDQWLSQMCVCVYA